MVTYYLNAICNQKNNVLEKSDFNPDYYTIRSAVDLSEPTDKMSDLVVLAAAYLGKARLIDNLQAHSPSG